MKLHLVLLPLLGALLFSSCAGSAWRQERSAAMASGGRTFTTFALNNMQGMHDHLKYDEELSDLEEAYRYATPAEQDVLFERYKQVKFNQARDELRAQQRSRAISAALADMKTSNSSAYQPRQTSSPDSSQQKIDNMWFNDHVRRTQSGQSYNSHNPYSR